MSGPIRRDASSDESNFVGATGGDPRVGRVDESNTQPPRRSLVSGPVGATRRTTAERVESTVELCRSDKSTGRYDPKTRVGPRRVASRRAWTWLMSRPTLRSYVLFSLNFAKGREKELQCLAIDALPRSSLLYTRV